MIQQLQLVLAPPTGVRVPQAWAYRLYGWLMAQLPADVGDALHLQGEHPIAHFLHFSPEKQTLIWTVNLLNETVRQSVSPPSDVRKGDFSARTDPAGHRSPCFPRSLRRRADPLWSFLR